VIKAELWVVLDTLKEHDFQHAFKKWQKHCIHVEGGYLEGYCGQ
jgi:hypothetical protein